MKNKYDTIMEKVQVTDEMHDRILSKLLEADLDGAPQKVVRFPPVRKYLLAAACFVLLLIGAAGILRSTRQREVPPIVVAPEISEFNSAKELSKFIGFELEEIRHIPFIPQNTSYAAYGGEIAEVVYSDDSHTLRFRKSEGEGDISGDYNEYDAVQEIAENGFTVTIKGNGGRYSLAIWEKDGYSYSLQITEGIPESELIALVRNIREKE